MPYDIRQGAAGCKGWAVVNEKGELKGCHPGRSAALAHQRALYAATANEEKMANDKKKKIW